jgi:hypothetical protein
MQSRKEMEKSNEFMQESRCGVVCLYDEVR